MTTPQDQPDQPPGRSWPAPPVPGYSVPGYPAWTPPPGEGMAPRPPGPPSQRPKEVDLSFWLWVTSIVLGLIGVLFVVGQYEVIRDDMLEVLREQAQRQGETFDEQQLQAIAGVALALMVLFALFFSAMQLLFAFFMRKGRNWARIVLAVLGGLIGLSRLISLTGVQWGLTVVALIVLIGAIVTMFLPAANPWFRPQPQF